MIFNHKPQWILDLSVPKNVEQQVAEHNQVTLVHLDELSKITDATLQKRKQHIPYALQIIEEIETDFKDWLAHRKHAPLLKAIKEKWNTSANNNGPTNNTTDINKITGQIATFLKENPEEAATATKLLTHIFELEIRADAL